PNLTEISKKITESNAVVLAVKEVETLLASIDELATKAIGKKIGNNGLEANQSKNTSLLSGAYAISDLIAEKLNVLKNEELKEKIDTAKQCSTEFTNKLKSEHAVLGLDNLTDDNAQRAILKKHANKDKGAAELEKLFKAVENLSKAAQDTLKNAVKELTSPIVA
nr:Chain A, Outer Surface Protein C [Borreliella burgdorferi]